MLVCDGAPAVLAPLAVSATLASAPLTAACAFLAVWSEEAPWVCSFPPVVPFCVGVLVCGWLLEPDRDAPVVGDDVEEPVLLTAPPLAVALPLWLKVTPNELSEVPPTSRASVLFMPETLVPLAAATFPLLPPPLAVPPRPSDFALPLAPLLVALELPEVLLAVGEAVLVLP